MKIYSWNVNGLRAVHKKGALEKFIKKESPDIILFQEIKAKIEQLDKVIKDDTFIKHFNSAEKPGYSGVSIWVNKKHESKIEEFKDGMPEWEDKEGRVVQCFMKDTVVIGVYVPNGGKSSEAYNDKLKFFNLLSKYVNKLQKDKYKVILGGDMNVAHNDIDLAKPNKFRDHINFNNEVRCHLEKIMKSELIDSYRTINDKEEGAYTYWDNFSFSLPRGVKPRDVNEGWRLDYFFVDKETNKQLKSVKIHQDIFGSDHCPISVEL